MEMLFGFIGYVLYSLLVFLGEHLWEIVTYILVGAALTSARYLLEEHLYTIRGHYTEDMLVLRFEYPGEILRQIALWPLSVLKTISLSDEALAFWARRKAARPLMERIRNMNLQNRECIRIYTENGKCLRGGYKSLREGEAVLYWCMSGNQLSAGGWDCSIPLDEVRFVERVCPGEKDYTPPDYPWW